MYWALVFVKKFQKFVINIFKVQDNSLKINEKNSSKFNSFYDISVWRTFLDNIPFYHTFSIQINPSYYNNNNILLKIHEIVFNHIFDSRRYFLIFSVTVFNCAINVPSIEKYLKKNQVEFRRSLDCVSLNNINITIFNKEK